MMEKNITNKPENSSWLKIKLLQFIGFILIIAAFYLLFSIYFFDYEDYGNPYASIKEEKIIWFYYIGSWINGASEYWLGKFNWAIPFVPFIIGYKLLKKDNLNNFFIRLLLLLISIIFICSSLNNLNVEAGKIGGIASFLITELIQYLDFIKYISFINYAFLFIGLVIYVYSVGIKFIIYPNILVLTFKAINGI